VFAVTLRFDAWRLQERIATERCDIPIIFLSGHVDLPAAVKAIKRGALEFLIKPFDSGHAAKYDP
jgi:FixJ family two-component response regulator